MREEKTAICRMGSKYSYKEDEKGDIVRYVTATRHYRIDEYDDVFDKEGRRIGEAVINTRFETERERECADYGWDNVILFGLEFKTLKQSDYIQTMEEVNRFLGGMKKSFNRKIFQFFDDNPVAYGGVQPQTYMFPWTPMVMGSTRNVGMYLTKDELSEFSLSSFKKSKNDFLKRYKKACHEKRSDGRRVRFDSESYEVIKLRTDYLFKVAVEKLERYFLCEEGGMEKATFSVSRNINYRFHKNIDLRDAGKVNRVYTDYVKQNQYLTH